MKKILFVAASAILLAAGCQKTEIINHVGGDSLSFSTNMNKLTKASDAESTGEVNLQEQNFRVWAYGAYEDANTPATELNAIYDGIENLPVTYAAPTGEATVGKWGTEKQYFWPGVGKELKFFAVSDGKDKDHSNVAIGTDINSLTVTDFEVTPNSYNTDLMVADFVKQHQDDKIVDLNFHHALSKVEFVFKTIEAEDVTVYVQSLLVKDLETKGTLTVAPATSAPETTDETGEYSATVTPVAFDWDVTTVSVKGTFADDYATEVTYPDGMEEGADTDKSALRLTNDAQTFTTWLMLPQPIEDKKVEITYVINNRKFTSIFPLNATNLTEWVENQYVKYTIVLAPNIISFNPIVAPWDPAQDVEDQN